MNDKPDYGGMTANERLFAAGLIPAPLIRRRKARSTSTAFGGRMKTRRLHAEPDCECNGSHNPYRNAANSVAFIDLSDLPP